MKARILMLVSLAITAGALVTGLLAQTDRQTSSDKVADAFALLEAGHPQQAQELVAPIPQTDPDFPAAQCCLALCLYERKDTLGFLKAMKSPVIEQAQLPAAIRDELNVKHLEALFQYRKFEEILPRVEAIQATCTDPVAVLAVHEFQKATLYERGMKKITEAGFLRSRGDADGAEKRLTEGQQNLGQYLRLSADVPVDGYQALTNRDAQTELVKTLTALGGEKDVLAAANPAEREATALAILQLSIRTKPEAVDDNPQRMTNFLTEFPNNKRAPRLRYDMANTALEKGWRLKWNTDQAKRNEASAYLDQAHAMLTNVVLDGDAGVADADVMEAKKGIMRVYYAKQEWAALSDWVSLNVTNVPVGGKDWVAFKLYAGAGLARQRKSVEAAKELDEALSVPFTGHPSYDGRLISAVKWRIRVAKQMGDEATIYRMEELVLNSNCYGSLKRTFATDFKEMIANPHPFSK